jgi:hypothetical protein
LLGSICRTGVELLAMRSGPITARTPVRRSPLAVTNRVRKDLAVDQQKGPSRLFPTMCNCVMYQGQRTGRPAPVTRSTAYEQPLVVPQDGQAWQLPERIICTPHWKQ